MTAPLARFSERVSAIARFGESVRTEADPRLGFDDAVDDGPVLPGIHVIDELSSLVPEEPSVFELRRAFHTLTRY